ncbi:MAG TPA: sigma-70 family RNA polymerase sigma factor [Pirellulales bacterium]|nr:sigma-70 family RNA polymerase sigma factor [Pirellulales bacterium]
MSGTSGTPPPFTAASEATSTSLLERVKTHDALAWRRLLALYGPLVYHWARQKRLQDQDASDIVQEVFRNVATHIGSFRRDREGDSFRGWLWTITRNKIRDQIAAVGDAESDAQKQALFEKVRQGSVRVLLGSTQKMGTGTNVQKRLVALHHLDAPWKPAEVEQRDGRILRQGNENKEVAIYRYVTAGSFDAYMWQALETKARFIGQVITGDNSARRAEDIGSQELSYAEVKAIASGNPAVLTLAEADAELQRLSLLKKSHLDEQYVARRSVRDLPATIATLSERLSKLTADETTANAHADDPIAIGGRTYPREDVAEILGGKLDALPMGVREMTRIKLGTYRGLGFGIVLHPQFPPDVYLEGAIIRHSTLSREHQGPRAVLNAVERLASAYGSECVGVRQDLTIAESQLRDYQARLGKPFPHDAYLAELTGLRDQLKAGLSAGAHESGKEEGPSVAELAGKIKAIKSAQSIEATPQRARQKHSTAEEPVTARIRRRAEATPATGPAIDPDAAIAEAGAAGPPAVVENSPPMTFRERIAIERQRKDLEPSIP